RSRLGLGQFQFAQPAAWTRPEPADIVGDLRQSDRIRAQGAAQEGHSVFRGLRFEMIARLDERQSCASRNFCDYRRGEACWRVRPRAYGCCTEWQLINSR